MKIFFKFIKLFSLSLIVLGFYLYFNEKLQFSNYRIILFVISPISLGLILLFVNTNIKLIIFNTIVIFGIFSILFETYFLFERNNKKVNRVNLETKNNIPQLCGTFFKKTKNLKIYPLGGMSNLPVKLVNKFSNRETTENTDNFGFKNSNKWSTDDKINFVFIGDSFTYGADVAHYEGFVDYFSKINPRTINFGCGGTGPIIQKGIFSEYVKKIKPSYVIWNLNLGNDINSDLPTELKSFYKNYLNDNFSQNLINNQSEIDKIYKEYWIKFVDIKNDKLSKKNFEKKNIEFTDILKLKTLRNFLGLNFSFSSSSFETLKSILYTVKAETNSWNGELIINVIPSQIKYIHKFHLLDYDSYNDRLFNFLENNNFNYINLANYIQNDNYYKYMDGHFTAEGNKLVSEIILKKLVNKNN